MSDIEDESEPVLVDQLAEEHVDDSVEAPVSSRRSSFVERTRRLKDEPDEVGPASPASNGHQSGFEAEVVSPEADDSALYDEVDSECIVTGHVSDRAAVALDEFADIPEEFTEPISTTNPIIPDIAATAPEEEVEEELEGGPGVENHMHHSNSKKSSFVDTEVFDDIIVTRDMDSDERESDVAVNNAESVARPSPGDKTHTKSVLVERAATKLHQADAAEAVAMAAMKEKAERKAALSAAKRQHADSTVNDKKDVASNEHRHQTLPSLPDSKSGTNRKQQSDQMEPKSDYSVKSGKSEPAGNYEELSLQHKDDNTNQAPPQRSKGFLHRIRKSKAASDTAGIESTDEASAVNNATDVVGGQSSNLGPKPPRRKLGGAAGRPGRRIASSTTEDGADPQMRPDSEVLRLPPLVHPRSSPDPSQLGDEESMKVTENGEPSNKIRRHRKPLFLRMIERAQQQTLEDERQKNEQYAEQKKVRQRNNPTAEQLKEHRMKHDELMRAKQEESRRSLAEAAAANARAAKKLSQAGGADAGAPTGEVTPVANDDAASVPNGSNAVKKKKKKIPGVPPAGGPKHSVEDPGGPAALPPMAMDRAEGSVNGLGHRSPSKGVSSSPKKVKTSSTTDSSHSKHRSSEGVGGRNLFPGGDDDSPASATGTSGHSSPVRNAAKKANTSNTSHPKKAAKVMAQLPDLTTVESVAAFCAPDWVAAFARVDLDEVNNDIETDSSVPSIPFRLLLQPPPPSVDIQQLMKQMI